MNDQALKWLRAAPLPALIFGAYVYAYAIDKEAGEASKTAAVAAEGRREQARRLEHIDEKLDKLLEAVVQLRVEVEQSKPAAKPAKKEPK